MTGWDKLIGHQWAVSMLRSAIEHGRVGHAYLITGPTQVGKATLALTFAQALNCTAADPVSRPCGQCRACRLIGDRRHPDLHVVRGETSGRARTTLKIDQIRNLQQQLTLTASEARYKIALIRGFESANQNAANAFLKTLEEPPNNVVLLLTATEADTLLPTIVSRCRLLALRPLPQATIQAALEQRWSIPSDRARLLAHLAHGRLGWAVSAALEPTLLDQRESAMKQLQEALAGSRVARFALAENLAGDPEALPDLLHTWSSWWRDVLLLGEHQQVDTITNVDHLDTLRQLAAGLEPSRALASLKHTELTVWQLQHNANTRLAMENLLLSYPHVAYAQAR
ncbi:MAG: DNA polymerase III subunit delta' [Candidatus Promineifilaceae bacterium]|nr:DNA polymerase III subunit delta' [Candidatus Promineifilaceae bacterium]